MCIKIKHNHINSLWGGGILIQMISEVTGIMVPQPPALEILNLGIENFPIQFCTVVTHILLPCRIMISRH